MPDSRIHIFVPLASPAPPHFRLRHFDDHAALDVLPSHTRLYLIDQNGIPVTERLTMLSCAVAHNLIAIVAGTSFGFTQFLIHNDQFKRVSEVLKYLLGGAVLVLGVYLIYQGM